MKRSYIQPNWKQNRSVYWFVLPALAILLLFSYYPAGSAIFHAFFIWDGGATRIFCGLDNFRRAFSDPVVGHGFFLVGILVVANLFKMIPSIALAVVIHRLTSPRWSYFYRALFVVPMIIPQMVAILIWKFYFDPTFGVINDVLEATGLMGALVRLDGVFGWNVFFEGVRPAWLAQRQLVIPSLVFWGFPWVGVVGILIYLAGLGNIDPEVYEAARVDGTGPFRLFLHVELPLIMTQVRLNLILMIINTLRGYELMLVVLGDSGGPGGIGMVPGLYMFRKAFLDQEAGYASTIGLLMFFVILFLTWINQKFVRVEK